MQIPVGAISVLMWASIVSAIVALCFLQSCAKGLARLLLVFGGILAIALPLAVSVFAGRERTIAHGLVAAGAINVGILLISTGVILFCLTLPRRRFLVSDSARS
ncbi:MAG: hypothetical protein ABR497_01545 [Kiritimatiellia bacterium]|nr:hypothetical protein [Lentisphaerota bacterium]